MKPEYEARFCDVDVPTITARLAEIGAQQTMPRTLMRRIVFKNSDIEARQGWLRLRDEGAKVSLTYKQAGGGEQSSIDSTLEAEINVSAFEGTRKLLEAIGFAALRYQENYREEWRLNAVTYDVDTWPDLPTFLEVESDSAESVQAGVAQLGLDFTQATFGSVDEVYLARLGRDILAEPSLVFAPSKPG